MQNHQILPKIYEPEIETGTLTKCFAFNQYCKLSFKKGGKSHMLAFPSHAGFINGKGIARN